MPAQRAATGLLGKYGNQLQKAHEEHKNDETVVGGFSDLPPGIKNGIAQLIDCKFDTIKEGKDNAGEYFFYAAAVVVEPIEHSYIPGPGKEKVVKVEGLRTTIIENIFDTPNSLSKRKTIKDHWAWVLNEVRKLGIDTANLEVNEVIAAVDGLAESAKSQDPGDWIYIKFHTWQPPADANGQAGRVISFWDGLAEDYVPQDTGAGMVEKPTATVNGVAATAKPQATPTNRLAGAASKASETREEVDPNADIHGDIEALVAMAKSDGEGAQSAQEELTAMAVAAGATEEDVDTAGSWDEVAEMIRLGQEAENEGEEGEAASEPEIPAKGQVWRYAPTNPKTKKAGKPVEVEIVSVNADKMTAVLKSLVDKKTQYKDVPFDKLTPVE